jgi:PKHD-type hydroxylase
MTTKNSSWALNTDYVTDWVYAQSVFSKEECQKIIDIGTSKNMTDSTIFGNNDNHNYRDSQVSWLYACDDMEWVFRRLTDVVTKLNNQYFKFDIFGFLEGLQFTRYDAPNGKYDAHVDKTFNGVVRKLSLSIQLTDSNEYEGGELQIITSKEYQNAVKNQGDLILFPSYILHRVTPVTKGTRYSLVSWISGQPFK